MRMHVRGLVATVTALAFAVSAQAQVVINEILPNPGSDFDGAEFIELYNPTGGAVNLTGWVLTGTEFNGTCGGEDHWQFPAGASIPAGGYIVVAKDVEDAPPETDDGFRQRFGFDPDFEMYDADRTYETDDGAVANLNLLTNEGFDDQIGLIPDNGYGATCSGTFNQYDALYLYNGTPGGGGTIVDVIEYRSALCVGDVCLGVNGSDNDAFVGLPGVGESLGRDASGSDTDNPSADLALGTPTPGSANIANTGPALSGLSVDNPDPTTSEAVMVTIDATDPDGIGPMFVVYTVNGGSPDSSAMAMSAPGQYSGMIPAQSDGDNVDYFVRARDAVVAPNTGVSKFPDFGSRQLRWGTQSIFDVQFHSPPTDVGFSAEVGNAVNIEGIVTSEPGLFNGGTFTIQTGSGPWTAVHCFDNTATTTVQRGDSVRVAGVVEEYFNLTEVTFFGPQSVTILSSGNPLPAAFLPPGGTSWLTTGAATGETLEGVYTRLENLEVTLDDDGFGQWQVTDTFGTALIGDDAFYLYIPTLGDSLDAVEGITSYSFGERKLEPRDNADIQGPPLVSTVRYSPIPPTAAAPISFTSQITDNGSISRAKLYFSTDNGATFDSTDLSNTVDDEWAVNIGPFPNGTEVEYHIEVTDNDGFNGRAPFAGDYDLYVGLRTINTIQSTMSATSDSSLFEGSPTNVAGIVTMAPGTLADNIFTIQSSAGTPAFHGIHVFSGGNLTGLLAVGDSVTVAGDVDEFFGLTQIRMHYTDAYTNHGAVGSLPAFELDTTDFPADSTGIQPASEAWEGVLIQFNGSTVTNAAAGFGQYYIDNTAPSTGEETLVDDEARVLGSLSYTPTLSDAFTYRGIGDFSFGQYKLQPRDDADILPFNPGDATGVNPISGRLDFALRQNSPNPFGIANTSISFSIPRTEHATLRVFDVQGRLVRTLLDAAVEAGPHTIQWNGRNDSGREVSSGVYFYRLTAGEKQATRKAIVLR